MTKFNQKLLFIYNADSGIANALIDQGKKYLTPSEYACQLCMVSYGSFGMRKDWKKFTKELPYEIVFLHRNELEESYPSIKTSFPAVILIDRDKTKILLSAEDFKNIASLDDLKLAAVDVLKR